MTREEAQSRLAFLVERTNALYRAYRNDPVYGRAALMLETNTRIIDLLYRSAHPFDPAQRESINRVLDHFGVWRSQFFDVRSEISSADQRVVLERCSRATTYPELEIDHQLSREIP